MSIVSHRSAYLLALMLGPAISGCFNLDFGSGLGEIEGCGPTPLSVAMSLEARYALGAKTTLHLGSFENPSVVSSHPEVVDVGPIYDDEVTLSFEQIGAATITISDGVDQATARVAVAQHERFEVALPYHADPVIPLAGRAVVLPEFQVAYFDSDGRLSGGGLATSTWPAPESGTTDSFRNYTLEPGPQRVDVQVGDTEAVILFQVVAHEDVQALEILETDLGQNRIRVDAVGLTESGTQVWNIFPSFEVDGEVFYISFEYIFDPDAPPSLLTASSWVLGDSSVAPAEKLIHRAAPPEENPAYATAALAVGGAPMAALLSLILMTLGIRLVAQE